MPLTLPETVAARIQTLESEITPVLDYEIGSLLGGLHKGEGLTADEQIGAWAEGSAFNFMKSQPGEESIWGTYFAPMASWTVSDGSTVYVPDIKKEFDLEIVKHWEDRSGQTPHPVMRAQYADLVWDLKEQICGTRPDVLFAKRAVDSYLEVCDRDLFKGKVAGIRSLRRAMEIAIRIGDSPRIELVRDAMFAFYAKVADPRQGGTWPFLFDTLYANKKVPLTSAQEASIIASLEQILQETSDRSNNDQFSPWSAQSAAERLARHYDRMGNREGVVRVTRSCGKAFEAIAQEAAPLLAISWLQPVIENYRNRGMTEDAARAQLASAEKGKNVAEDMKSIEVKVELSQSEMEDFLSAITGGSIEETLTTIAVNFVPKVKDARSFLETSKRDSPFAAMVGIQRISGGMISASAGSVEADPEGRLMFQLCQNMNFAWPFLCLAMDRARSHHSLTVGDLLTFIFKSPLFLADYRDLVAEGLGAYLAGDYVKAIHVILPQIEQALRALLGLTGVPITKVQKNETMQVKNLNDLLREQTIKDALGEDLQLYLLVFLADSRGFNLRNEVCHGLLPASTFRKELADRVVHCLLTLALIRAREEPSKDDGEVA